MTFYTDSFPPDNIMLAPGKRARGGFMHRCSSGLLLTLTITFVVALTGCLGKSNGNSGNGGVESVSLSPLGNVSIEVGTTQVFSASGKNAAGGTVVSVDIQYVVTSGTPNTSAPLSIASNGNACAGTWDVNVAICSPGNPGIALVTAVINGVSSPVTTIYVHQHVASIQIVSAEQNEPPYQYPCFPQGQIWTYQGIAYNGGTPPVDITNTVGPMNWSSSNAGVVTTTAFVPAGQPTVLNQIQATAKSPGITQLFATVAGTTSSPFPYTTCLIQAIYLQNGGQNQGGNSIVVNNGGTVPVTAVAIDTLYNIVDFARLPAPPLTWSTTNPEVAAFSTVTNSTGANSATARNNLGGATLFASCSPPSCNIGVLPGLPIYSSTGQLPDGTTGYGSISVNVTLSPNATPPIYSAWATTTDCQDQPGCTSALFAVTPGTTPIGAIVTLPRTPNSMMFNHVASPRIYLGSDQGLMYMDVTSASPTVTLVSNAQTPCNVSLCGTVLTISNDGKLVVVSDPPAGATPGQVYIYNGGTTGSTTPVDLILTNSNEKATAAAFSPDQLKIFILTDMGNMYVYSTVDAFRPVQLATSASQANFSSDGSFAYVAGTPTNSVSAYSTCSLPTPGAASVDIGSVSASSATWGIFPSPVVVADAPLSVQTVIALEPPNVEVLIAKFKQNPITFNQFTCNPPTMQSFATQGPPVNLGEGDFTPLYAQLVANGTELVVVAQNIPTVILFDVANGTRTYVPLLGNAYPLSASSSTDGSAVFVAACDQYTNNDPTQPCAVGSVHIVNTISLTDQRVPYVNGNNNGDTNMCNNGGNPAPQCLPNLVAIRPQ
jgi:hypothetical protein